MAHLLGAEALQLEFPTRIIFDSISLGVDEGDRIGVVGRNGDGKSSLLAMLAGRLEPNGGRVTVRRGVTVGVLDQGDTLDDDDTVASAVVGDLPEHEWAGDPRVRDVTAGLLAGFDWHAPIADLSGGQRRRVSLAKLLIGDHDVLMLDEPTNHLDVEAIAWLAEHLKRRWASTSGALLVVTHDRWFLDEVCTRTWEVHDRIVEPFDGGYAAYILQRVERDRMAASSEAKRQNLARKELAWLRRGAPARTSKPQFRIDAANALIADVPEIRDPVALRSLGGRATRQGCRGPARRVRRVRPPGPHRCGVADRAGRAHRHPGRQRRGQVDPAGSGRRHRRADIRAASKRGKTVKVATLTQRLDELETHLNDPVRVVLERLRTTYTFGAGSKAQELTPGQLLERMGFSSAQLSTPVKDLSGGQKRRLQLLLVLLDQPNVLILDEPTNDLDTDMLAAIEDLLDSWPGTLLVVSHDRYFIERVTDQQYAILGGKLRHLPGGVDEYLRLRRRQEEQQDAAASASAAAAATPRTGLSGAELRTAQKEVAAIERRLAKLTSLIDAAHVRIAEHDQNDYTGVAAQTNTLQELESEVSQLEERWLELSELV